MGSLFRRFRAAFGLDDAHEPLDVGALQLREMEYADVQHVRAIEVVSFGSPWRTSSYSRAISDPRQHFYVAEAAGQMVGYAGFWVEGDSAHIAKVAVRADCQRRGIGAALLEFLLDEIRRLGLGQAHLEVRKSNVAAQRLYRRFGFRFERVQPQAYPDNREDALILVRDDLLSPHAPTPEQQGMPNGANACPD
jgi:ribosomal-protein-alanine N-acetyltransferase